MKLKYFIFLGMLLSLASSAFSLDNTLIDGIYYRFDGEKAIVSYAKYEKYKYYSYYSGNIIVPESVTYNDKTYNVTSIDQRAFYNCKNLISVTIPNSVTSIGECAFQECSGLTSVTLPYSLTSIGIHAFYGCSGLTSVNIPNSVTSIGRGAFAYCLSLTSVTIPNSVTSIGDEAFYNCTVLTSVAIGNGVTSIGVSAFERCSGLTSATIGNSVTSIGDYAFYWCTSLTSVNIPNSVTNIGEWAFYGCSALTSIVVPNSETSIGGSAFQGCSGLKFVALPTCEFLGFEADTVFVNGESVDIYKGVKVLMLGSKVKKLKRSDNPKHSSMDLVIYGDVPQMGDYCLLGYEEISLSVHDKYYQSYLSQISNNMFKGGKVKKIGLLNERPSHVPSLVYAPSDKAVHWEYSRDGGNTWTILENSECWFYRDENPERGTVLYRVLNKDNSYGEIMNITYYDVVPSNIAISPQGSTKTVDESVTFTAEVQDDGYTYQWMHNGNAISGATGSSYTIPVIKAADAGTYYCVVSNPVSEVKSIEVNLTVKRSPQTIDFPEIEARTYGDADFSLPLLTNKGQTITYQSSNQSVAKLEGNIVSITGVGETNIIASQGGSDDYLPAATVTRKLTINKVAQSIVFEELPEKTYEDLPFDLPEKSNQGLPLSYQILNTNVATLSGYTVTIVGAGETEIIASQPGDGIHYAATPVSRTLKVKRKEQHITFNVIPTKVYGDAPIQLNELTDKNLEIQYVSDKPDICEVDGHTLVLKHPGAATITASQSGNNNYLPATNVQQVVTIEKAPQNIGLDHLESKTYGEADFELPKATDKGLEISYASTNKDVATVEGNVVHIIGTGTTTIKAVQEGNEYYKAASAVEVDFTVNKAYQTIQFAELPNVVYGAEPITLAATTNNPSARLTYTSSNPQIASVEGKVLTIVGAGSCYITVEAPGDKNFYAASPVQRQLIVEKATQEVTFAAIEDVQYGATPISLQASSNRNLPIIFSSSNPKIVSIREANAIIMGAGSAVITASQEGNGNYEPATASITINVNKAHLTIKADNQTRFYGDDNAKLTIQYSGFVNDENEQDLDSIPVAMTNATCTSDVGSYKIDITRVEDKNYEIQFQDGLLTVDKAKLIVKVNDANKKYGDENPELTCSFEGWKNNEDESVLAVLPTIQTTAKTRSDAGAYPIYAEGAQAKNYAFDYQDGTLTIEKAPLMVRAKNVRVYHGEVIPELTMLFSGFKNNELEDVIDELPSIACSANSDSEIGSYPITLTGGADNNYELNLQDGILFISTSVNSIAIWKSNGEKLYFLLEEMPVIKFTSDEAIIVTTEEEVKFPSAEYLMFTYEQYVKKIQEINFAEIGNKKYGDKPIELKAMATSGLPITFSSSDSTVIAINDTIAVIRGVGSTVITALQEGSAKYLPDSVSVSVKVSKASLLVEADDKTREYGDENPELTYKYSGFVYNESAENLDSIPTISTKANRTSDAGTYSIHVEGGASPNYDIDYQDAILEVIKANLYISADDKDKLYGDSIPRLTCSYEGWKNNDSDSVMLSRPTLSTIADMMSNVGIYAINVKDGKAKNYDINYQKGRLTINKAPLLITADDKEMHEGENLPEFTMSFEGFKGKDTQNDIDELPKFECEATSESPQGTYPIILLGGEDNNYELTLLDGMLTILESIDDAVKGSKDTLKTTFNLQNNYFYVSNLIVGQRVTLYSIDGKQLKTDIANDFGKVVINLKELTRGIYLVKVNNVTYKFLKK